MGQQQLLLVIVGLVVVGLAVAIAITMFRDNAASQNRDAITNDLYHLATKARHYYHRPVSLGGGNRTFVGLGEGVSGVLKLVDIKFQDNDNGTYTIINGGGDVNHVVFQGVGKTPLPDVDDEYPTAILEVYPERQVLTIIK